MAILWAPRWIDRDWRTLISSFTWRVVHRAGLGLRTHSGTPVGPAVPPRFISAAAAVSAAARSAAPRCLRCAARVRARGLSMHSDSGLCRPAGGARGAASASPALCTLRYVVAVFECMCAVIFRLPVDFEGDRAGRPWERALQCCCGLVCSQAPVRGWTYEPPGCPSLWAAPG